MINIDHNSLQKTLARIVNAADDRTRSRRARCLLTGISNSAPAHAANATMINPGITRMANDGPPLMAAKIILLLHDFGHFRPASPAFVSYDVVPAKDRRSD
jgi:hypothetical protein